MSQHTGKIDIDRITRIYIKTKEKQRLKSTKNSQHARVTKDRVHT